MKPKPRWIDRFVHSEKAASELGISARMLRQMAKDGRVPAVPRNGGHLFDLAELAKALDWLAQFPNMQPPAGVTYAEHVQSQNTNGKSWERTTC